MNEAKKEEEGRGRKWMKGEVNIRACPDSAKALAPAPSSPHPLKSLPPWEAAAAAGQ